MKDVISALYQVMANVIAYYICKWFDKVIRNNEPKD